MYYYICFKNRKEMFLVDVLVYYKSFILFILNQEGNVGVFSWLVNFHQVIFLVTVEKIKTFKNNIIFGLITITIQFLIYTITWAMIYFLVF